ncbi:hypothetical protein OHA18_02060 [Kribbella sp. NBC_00709]|uniref:hypothetical protein n=1 Tax=Kribbella sp. NBC_00709 TaxID=2975972 RepID=UPI002E29B28D|nr:hypothetical protein [Kribbella sp. NBC_00709]
MDARIRWISSMLTIAALMVIPLGCAGSDESSAPPSASGPSPVHFTSKAFSVPLTVALPASLKSQATEDTKNLISWGAVSGQDGVRFLLPVVVYQPDSTTPQPVPTDYPSYLAGLAGAGATFVDKATTTVDGKEATLMTGTSTRSLDGTLGCPAATNPAAVCFGLQPEAALRIAVVNLNGKTMVAWARTQQDNADAPQFFAEFEAMLRSLQLS